MKLYNPFFALLFLSFSSHAQDSWKATTQELIFKNPPFAECHASTIVEVTPTKMMAACFGGTEERNKDVGIWLATWENGQWSKPVLMGDGVINDTLRYPSWNPVLFKIKEGKLFLFYKVGPTPEDWWGMVRTSVDDGKTWTAPRRLPDGILGPIKNKPVQLANGTVLAPSSTEKKGNWKAHIEKSSDLGNTWQLIPVDANTRFNVIQPSILFYPGNKLQILCRSKSDTLIQAYSDDMGNTWGPLSKTSLPNPNSGTDAVTLKNGTQILVYNPTKRGREWNNGRAKLNVAMSKDGVKWTDIAVLENGTNEEYSYPAVIQAKDGKVHITYTYNRKNVKHVVLEPGK
ncbi:MAG: sialidase family protein [Chitinophagaceae bacterium]